MFVKFSWVLFLFALQNVDFTNSDSSMSCGSRLPAYMIVENARLQVQMDYIIENITENDCTFTCSDNRLRGDQNQRVMCSSFNYIRRNKTCFVYQDNKSKPSGARELVEKKSFRYFEKFCLPEGSPLECGEARFIRLEQNVLNGFAINVTRTKKLDVCIQACLELNELCKSVMFFYEVGECILNGGTAKDSEEGLAEETKDKVVYVENGCMKKEQPKNNNLPVNREEEKSAEIPLTTAISVKTSPVTEADEPAHSSTIASEDKAVDDRKGDKKKNGDKEVVSTTQSSQTREEEKRQQEREEEEKNEIVSAWTEWSDCDRPDGRQVRRRNCKASSKLCRGKLLQSRPCPATTVPPEEEPTEPPKKRTTTPGEEIPSGAWTVWSKKCQSFPASQTCENGKKVGFQTRQCLGSPFECHGTFMRYCFIPC